MQPAGDARKEQDCVYFLQGRCLKGLLCPFRHDQTKAGPQQDRQPAAGDCIYFLQGWCAKGAMCPFKHDPSKQGNAVPMAHGAGHAEMFGMPLPSMIPPNYSLPPGLYPRPGPPGLLVRPPPQPLQPSPPPADRLPMYNRLEKPSQNIHNTRDSEPSMGRSEQRLPSRLAGRLGPVPDDNNSRDQHGRGRQHDSYEPYPPPPHRSSVRVVEVRKDDSRDLRAVHRNGGHASVHPRDRDSLSKRKREGANAHGAGDVGDFSKESLETTIVEAVFEAPKSIAEIRKAKQQKKSDPVSKETTKPKAETTKPVQKASVRAAPAPAAAAAKAPEPAAAAPPPSQEVPEEEVPPAEDSAGIDVSDGDLPDMGDDGGIDDDDDFEAQMRALEDAI